MSDPVEEAEAKYFAMTEDQLYYALAKKLFEYAKEAKEAGNFDLANALADAANDAIEQAIELLKKQESAH